MGTTMISLFMCAMVRRHSLGWAGTVSLHVRSRILMRSAKRSRWRGNIGGKSASERAAPEARKSQTYVQSSTVKMALHRSWCCSLAEKGREEIFGQMCAVVLE